MVMGFMLTFVLEKLIYIDMKAKRIGYSSGGDAPY